MKWPWISGELPEEFVRRAAARGKWSFVWRIGILGWSVPLICGVNLWFNSLTRYSRFTVLVASLLLCLPAGVVVGLGLYGGARETHEECREFWLRQRGRGKASFVWRYGVLSYGLSMFSVFAILSSLAVGFNYQIILVNLVLWPAGGLVCGLWLWFRYERKYR